MYHEVFWLVFSIFFQNIINKDPVRKWPNFPATFGWPVCAEDCVEIKFESSLLLLLWVDR